ncbi:cell adhesion molecule Dscam1-like isoform X2 [Tachypleus tridentatus]|uniref:cell adhesion molecule Dscam1-like isoform X2 n=1 Tax=Tachypleus tridentatus TaxID=6853 RepID=UPI003FD3113E
MCVSRAMKAVLLITVNTLFICGLSPATSEKFLPTAPLFTHEPPQLVQFSNSKGAHVSCAARGDPSPHLTWRKEDGQEVTNVAEVVYIRPDGTLVFQPFSPEKYQQEIHSSFYQCLATNSVGTIGSRKVTVEAALDNKYIVRVYSDYITQGNTAVLRCQIPPFLKGVVMVTSWTRDDGVVIHADEQYGGKHSLLPSGELIVTDVQRKDTYHSYKCQTRNRLTGFIVESSSAKLIVTESQNVIPAKIIHRETHVRTPRGRKVLLPCVAQGYPIPSCSWFKNQNGRQIYIGRDPHLEVVGCSLVVREPGVRYSGKYTCFANNTVGTDKAETELLVYDEKPVLEEVFPESTLEPGSSVSLRCSATGTPLPQVTWQLDGFPPPNLLRFRVGDYVTQSNQVVSHVNISMIKPEDGGYFTCIASNEVGKVLHQGKLNVIGPPVVRKMPNMTVLSSHSFTVQCPAGGYPLTFITWEKDGRKLPQNHRQKVFNNGTLVVKNINRKGDEGVYRCFAENDKGQTDKNDLIVEVIVPPKIDPFRFSEDLEEGMRSVVFCAVVAGDPPISLTWLKDGEPLQPEGVTVEMLNDFTSTLVFQSAHFKHSGNYTCVASNSVATVQYTATMVVNVPPFWKIQPTDQSAVKGETVTIDCQAGGFPSPQIRWKKKQGTSGSFRTVISNPHIQILENGSLVLREVAVGDSGSFMCQANNGITPSLSVVIQLEVHVPAHVATEFQSITVRKGASVNLTCEAFGERPVVIKWHKDRQPLTIERHKSRYSEVTEMTDYRIISILKILFSDRQDSSLFSCIASNAHGTDKSNFQVLVQEKPHPIHNLRTEDVDSRSVRVSWDQPYSGNLPITGYLLMYRKQTDGETETKTKSIPSIKTTTTVHGLSPLTNYIFEVVAENSLGRGNPSRKLAVQTKEEAPATPPGNVRVQPVSSRALKVSWKTPAFLDDHTVVEGYYLGYKKVSGPSETYIYKTLASQGPVQEQVYELTSLERATKYAIHIQAYNSAGTGPASNDVIGLTLEYDPPPVPDVTLVSSTSTTVHIKWTKEKDNHVTGYSLHWKPQDGELKTKEISGNFGSYVLDSLRCGTRYQLYITASNPAGQSGPSKVVSLKTEGTAPVAPSKHEFLTVNSTSVSLHLSSWKPGGCPVYFFAVQYKPRGDRSWITVASKVLPETKFMLIPDLAPATWYSILVTAYNSAGSTDAEYVFSTLTEAGATLAPNPAQPSSQRHLYEQLTIIIPIICAGLIVLVVTIIVCMLHGRRHGSGHRRSGGGQTEPQAQLSLKEEPLSLEMLGKTTSSFDSSRDAVYFPSPYAMTRVPGFPNEDTSDGGSFQSGTKTPSETQRSHTYDVPFLVRRVGVREQRCMFSDRTCNSPGQCRNFYQVPQPMGQNDQETTSMCMMESITDPKFIDPTSKSWSRHWSNKNKESLDQSDLYRSDQRNQKPGNSDSDSEVGPTLVTVRGGDGEVSETECDREMRELMANKRDKRQLCVSIPSESNRMCIM